MEIINWNDKFDCFCSKFYVHLESLPNPSTTIFNKRDSISFLIQLIYGCKMSSSFRTFFSFHIHCYPLSFVLWRNLLLEFIQSDELLSWYCWWSEAIYDIRNDPMTIEFKSVVESTIHLDSSVVIY